MTCGSLVGQWNRLVWTEAPTHAHKYVVLRNVTVKKLITFKWVQTRPWRLLTGWPAFVHLWLLYWTNQNGDRSLVFNEVCLSLFDLLGAYKVEIGFVCHSHCRNQFLMSAVHYCCFRRCNDRYKTILRL